MSASDELSDYLRRPLSPPSAAVLAAIAAGPIDPAQALPLVEVARLLDPRPLPVETGWCTLPDGVCFVAVRTAMPLVSGEMIDWWFDWHPRDSLRYRIWHPAAHKANSLEPPLRPAAKAHWGAVHHPLEDVGLGTIRARIAFQPPSAMGLPGDQLENPDVAAVVCGYVGDQARHMRHTPMFHVFLRDGQGAAGHEADAETGAGAGVGAGEHGVVLRSAFWLGASLRPEGPLGPFGERLLNNRLIRRAALPTGLPRALATHCAEEYANLAALLPELFQRFGQGAASFG